MDHYPYRTKLDDALFQIQEGLRRIQGLEEYKELNLTLESAKLNLVTATEFQGGLNATVFVVTVAGEIGWKSTQTLDMTLESIPPPETEIRGLAPQAHQTLTVLGYQMLNVLARAKAGEPPLQLKEGTISLELVVDKSGKIEVATPSILETLFPWLKAEASAEVGRIHTSSLSLTFTSA